MISGPTVSTNYNQLYSIDEEEAEPVKETIIILIPNFGIVVIDL